MAKLSIESTIKELLANEQVKDKLDDLVPGLSKNPLLALAKNKTLKEVMDKLDDLLTDDVIDQIIDFLKDLKDEK
ncbi:MAG: hypothetical protein IKU54_06000 [Oscillospiraceae bacterium]|nr:hypothetical protein [Oscillospiraceae bacterium]